MHPTVLKGPERNLATGNLDKKLFTISVFISPPSVYLCSKPKEADAMLEWAVIGFEIEGPF